MKLIMTIILLSLVGLWVLSIPIFIFLEKRKFNKGYCTECGEKMQHFDVDSTGADGWYCENCGRVIWLNWINRTGKYD